MSNDSHSADTSNTTPSHAPEIVQPSTPPQEQSAPAQPARSQPNAPIDTLRDGALKVSIFRNHRENGDVYSFSPGRIYTDQQGQVRESKNLSGSEPLRMARLLDRSYQRASEFKSEFKAELREAQKPQERKR